MAYVQSYSQIVEAVIPRDAWDETYFSLMSLKAHLQAMPGYQRFSLWARDLDSGDIRIFAVTNWENLESLEIWLRSRSTVDAVLRAMELPPRSIRTDLAEEIL
ncbi:MAG: hypothetical protein KatS3mg050_2424 [Litorilinea sp.]|nr:MAG: hypothetical protein KatS3mg050_2424 [Litorilinea sp.]